MPHSTHCLWFSHGYHLYIKVEHVRGQKASVQCTVGKAMAQFKACMDNQINVNFITGFFKTRIWASVFHSHIEILFNYVKHRGCKYWVNIPEQQKK